MTTPPRDDRDDRVDDYLWDPAAPPAPEVQVVEQQLAPLRLDPNRSVPQFQPQRRVPRWIYGLAAAAAVVLVAGGAGWMWRWSWPNGRPWTIQSATVGRDAQLSVGSPLELAAPERARVRIARIGSMTIGGDSRLTLLSTHNTRHRLAMERGTVHIRVWAPPGSVIIRTPVGEVIDLGCEFDLTVTADSSAVSVRSGWVQLENGVDESLIPAGAASEMRAGRAPGVPVFLDAAPAFTTAVRTLEASTTADSGVIGAITATARVRDVFTLLMLIERGVDGSDRLAARAAELSPPPRSVTVNGVLRGDRDGLWAWRDTLPLPPPKSWLRNWRDALPDWLLFGGR